ncbi:MAG: hypothetical protein ACLSCQ_09690 [Evtepia gabavorous]
MNNNQTERKDGPHVSTSYPKRSGANCRHLRPHPHRRGGRTGHRGLGPGVYPTRQTALDAIQAGDMFVAEENGRLVATAKINQEQVPEYAEAAWTQDAPGTGHGTPHPGGGPPGQGAGLRLPLLWTL